MIPRTFPSTFASNGQQQMVVHFLTSVEGLARWSDYIPVKLAQGGPENSYSGCIDVVAISELTADTQAWKEYIPVYADSSATDAWTVNSVGYIPYNYALFADATMQLDLTNGAALDPRITFSRTTNATLTNSAGLIANAPMNLLTFSEQFDNAAWVKTRATITANATVAPNGTTTADKEVEDTSTGTHVTAQSVTLGNGTYTASVSLKAGERTFALFQMSDLSTGGAIVFVNLTTGAIVSSTGTGSWTAVSGAAVSEGNGWYRVNVTGTKGAGTVVSVQVLPSTDGTTTSYTGDGTSGLFTWGAQLELGSTATTYNPTTIKNLLGFTENFDNAAWTNKSNAFVQTNQLLWSQDFTNAAWTKVGATVASSANTLSFPKLNEAILQTATMSATVGTAATFSVVLSGSGTAYIGCFRLGAATYEDDRTLITLTSTPTRYTVSHTMVNAGQTGFGGFISRGTDGTATTVTATQAQLVNGTSAGDYKATYASTAAVGYPDIYGQPFAQKLVETTAAGLHYVDQPTTTISGTAYTGSVYVKAGERSWARLQFVGSAYFPNIYVNLADGSVGTVENSPISYSVTDVGQGWYRISMSAAVDSASTRLRVYPATANGTSSYTGDGTSGIYIFGAQLSDSASVDPYVYQPVAAPTSTAYYGPRFDYDPVTLAPKGLLIEEQRTNLLTFSEQFDNAAWTKSNAIVTANTAVAPNGTTTANKLIAGNTTGQHYVSRASMPITSGIPYTFTVYAKKAEWNYIYLYGGTLGTNGTAVFNLDEGTVHSTAGGVTATISEAGAGFYKCMVSGTTSGSTFAPEIHPAQTPSGFTQTGDGTSGIYIWGAQLEAGAFATSYIPTVASQVTRAADSASMIGNNFARWYNQTEGTLFADAYVTSSAYTSGVLLDVGAGGAFGTTAYLSWTGTGWALFPSVAPVNMSSTVTGTPAAKIAAALAANNAVIAASGLLGSVDTSCAMPVSATTLSIGRDGWSGSANYFNGTIARIAYYNRRLANTELQAITS